MAKIKKESEARTFRLRQDLCDKMDAFSESSMLSKTAIVERALDVYFATLEKDDISSYLLLTGSVSDGKAKFIGTDIVKRFCEN